mgnify:FL=1
MSKNYWGEPDEEPLPDWMNPRTYRVDYKRSNRTLNEVILEALKKPSVPIILEEPND